MLFTRHLDNIPYSQSLDILCNTVNRIVCVWFCLAPQNFQGLLLCVMIELEFLLSRRYSGAVQCKFCFRSVSQGDDVFPHTFYRPRSSREGRARRKRLFLKFQKYIVSSSNVFYFCLRIGRE